MKKLLLMLLALLMLCGTASALEEADLVGEWVLVRVSDAPALIEIKSDGTGWLMEYGVSECTWSIDAEKGELYCDFGGEYPLVFTWKDGKLSRQYTIYGSDGGVTLAEGVFTKGLPAVPPEIAERYAGEWTTDDESIVTLHADGTGWVEYGYDTWGRRYVEGNEIRWYATDDGSQIVIFGILDPNWGGPLHYLNGYLCNREDTMIRASQQTHDVFIGTWDNYYNDSFDMVVDAYGIVRLMYDDVTLMGTWEPLSDTTMRVTLADLPVTIDFLYDPEYDKLFTGIDKLWRRD